MVAAFPKEIVDERVSDVAESQTAKGSVYQDVYLMPEAKLKVEARLKGMC